MYGTIKSLCFQNVCLLTGYLCHLVFLGGALSSRGQNAWNKKTGGGGVRKIMASLLVVFYVFKVVHCY